MPKRKSQRLTSSKYKKIKNGSVTNLALLPTEILIGIFGRIKKEKNTLTKVCKRFNDIIGYERTLVINSEKLHEDSDLPVIKRSYKKIQIIGKQLNPAYLEAFLASSGESARSLFIGLPSRSHKSKIYTRTLMQVLNWLPNLEELTIKFVNAVPPLFDFEAIKPIEVPVLTKLKRVEIEECNEVLFDVFRSIDSIERLSITGNVVGAANLRKCTHLMSAIEAQKGLKFLQTSWLNTVYRDIDLPELQEIVMFAPNLRISTFTHMNGLISLPKLKKLTLCNRHFHAYDYIHFLERHRSQTLERLQIDSILTKAELETALTNYPALNYIKTYAFTWTKPL